MPGRPTLEAEKLATVALHPRVFRAAQFVLFTVRSHAPAIIRVQAYDLISFEASVFVKNFLGEETFNEFLLKLCSTTFTRTSDLNHV